MIIAAEYKNGRIQEFDPSTFTTTQALPQQNRGSRSVMTEFDLRVDDIEEKGLRLDLWWYDIATPSGTVVLDDVRTTDGDVVKQSIASRRRGGSIVLVPPEGMMLVSRISVYRAGSASTVAWRQGKDDWLIMGSKFDAARIQAYTDANTTSSNLQALQLFNYFTVCYPDAEPEEIGDMIGYPYGAIREIMLNEAANMEREAAADVACAEAPGVVDAGGTLDDSVTGEVYGAAPNAMSMFAEAYDDEDDGEDDDY